MNKIPVIIQREYFTRVRKKSFIVMTVLTPLLMASLFILPMALMNSKEGDHKKIAVIEEGIDFRGALKDKDDLEFIFLENVKLDDIKNTFTKDGYYGVLWISHLIIDVPNAVKLISEKQPPIGVLEYIENSLKKEIEKQKLENHNIANLEEIMKDIQTSVNIQTISLDSTGAEKNTSTGISMGLTYFLGLLMYMLIFIFGAQVMRGVIEEKTNRVVEVIISSVKPVQLMMGKIIGIALVGLTQFLIWVILTVAIASFAKNKFMPDTKPATIQQSIPANLMSENAAPEASMQQNVSPQMTEITKAFDSAMNQPWGNIIISFIFYFITGYLLYASIFAAIGSAVDNETETQQFMLPVMIPIIFALLVAMGTMANPESSLSFWCSMIPLTSPIVMMARIPFGVPYWQQALSMGLMLATFMGFVWMAAKIYRTGILMYGKRTSWKEMWKWLRYS